MRHAPLVRPALIALIAISLVGLTTSCDGQVIGLDGSLGEDAAAWLSTTPGRPADYTTFLVNHTGHVVILESATLMALKGFRPARLVHEAIEPRLRYATSDTGWPPTKPRIMLRKFAGYQIPPGHRVNILYSVVASKLGNYGATGITVTVLVSGRRATADLISVAGTCIVPTENQRCSDSFVKRIENAGNS